MCVHQLPLASLKLIFFYKQITTNTQMTSFILICHCTPLLPWFIILDKNNFVIVSHHYLTSGGYQVCLYSQICPVVVMVMVMRFAWIMWGKPFIVKIFQKVAHRRTKVNVFPYKQISVRNGDHEWLIITNAFILCERRRHCWLWIGDEHLSMNIYLWTLQHIVVCLFDKYI